MGQDFGFGGPACVSLASFYSKNKIGCLDTEGDCDHAGYFTADTEAI